MSVQEENESADSKTKILKILLYLIVSGPGRRTICTVRLSCLVLKPSLSTTRPALQCVDGSVHNATRNEETAEDRTLSLVSHSRHHHQFTS